MNSEERSNEEKYPHGSIGHTFPEAAALMEGLLAERNALESRLAAALARIAAVEADALRSAADAYVDYHGELRVEWWLRERADKLAASPTPTGPEPARCEHKRTEAHQMLDEFCEWTADCPGPATPEPTEETP